MIRFDGKTARGSYTTLAKDDALHVVSAFAQHAGLTPRHRSGDTEADHVLVMEGNHPKLAEAIGDYSVEALGAEVRPEGMGLKTVAGEGHRREEDCYREERYHTAFTIPKSIKEQPSSGRGVGASVQRSI